MAAFVLLWLIPIFLVGFILLLIAAIAPLTAYIIMRNKAVDNNLRVLTPEHLRFWFATRLNKIGFKFAVEQMDPHEGGVPVKLTATGGSDDRTNAAWLLLARQSTGYRPARELMLDCFKHHASAMMLDYMQTGVTVRIMVDGVWIPAEAKPRDVADPALESLKLLCGLNAQDRQKRQSGTFLAEYEKHKLGGTLTSQGTATGERVILQFEDKKISLKTLDEIGMRQKLQEQFMELMRTKGGFALFSAPPGGGLRTTTDVALHACDRFTREFVAVEDETRQYPVIENIPVTFYKPSEKQTPADILPKLFRTEPGVIIVRDLVNAETVHLMCEEAKENHRLMVSTVRAKDAAEAVLRVLAMGVKPGDFAEMLTVVVNQRLVRKLCEKCKEAYTPPANVLQQLGIPPGRVQAFYRPRQPTPDQKEVCEACNGIGYQGRTAIFEVLPVGDTVRKVLTTSPKLDLLRQAARKDGMKSLQDEGILLVVKGVTSLPELMRVLKQ
jgi:type II secretory ATPase GspE/PulE/Tfp pilus assembly ATPase PilB-like protein